MRSKSPSIRTIRDENVAGKRVLVRADLNVPLRRGVVLDDTRLRAALPTIRYLLERRATVILCSHLGRPGGKVVEALRLQPVARRLEELLKHPVQCLQDCVGTEVDRFIAQSGPGDVVLLENTRFHPYEEENGHFFAAQLAKHCDLFVNDAFGTAHRAHASTTGVAQHVPAVAGLLLEHELSVLGCALTPPQHPVVALFGGAKVAGKLAAVEQLLATADRVLVAGGIAHTLLAAQGITTGDSLADPEFARVAEQMLHQAGAKLVLPVDAVVLNVSQPETRPREVNINAVPAGFRIMDIGRQTVDLFRKQLSGAKTVIWNGPLGVCEEEPFANGTNAVARMIAELDALTLVGGGETAAVIRAAGLAEKITHLSTGGGAFLQFLQGAELPAVAALQQQQSPVAAVSP